MAWLRSHQELARHPKVKRLSRQLNISLPQAIGHLHLLWWWCMDYAQDGDLTEYSPEDIADACAWEGDAEGFVRALVDAGFVDNEHGLHVHDWEENAGRLIEQRKRNRERVAEARKKKCDVRNAYVMRTCGERNAYVQGLDKIREDKRRGDITIPDTCMVNPSAREESPPPPPPNNNKKPPATVKGWMPTPESSEKVGEAISRLEAFFGQYPFSPSMVGDGRADTCKEELSSILRLLTVDEVLEVVGREYERARSESKGTNLPRNLPYYMPAIKAAFFARDKELEEAERRREEEKRAQARASPEEPVPLGEILGKELTEEEREKIAERIRQTKERIKASG